jgi:hypothetical protein
VSCGGDYIPPLSVIPFLTSLTCSSEASFLNRTYHNQPTALPPHTGNHTIYDGILETVLVVNGLIKQTLTEMLLLLFLMDGRRVECEGSDSSRDRGRAALRMSSVVPGGVVGYVITG